MNAFQPMIRNILEGKKFTDYHQQIQLVEKVTKMDCGWPLQHCYDMVSEIFCYLQELESDVKSTATVFMTRINRFIVWPEIITTLIMKKYGEDHQQAVGYFFQHKLPH